MIQSVITDENIPMNAATNVTMEAAGKKNLSDKKKDLGQYLNTRRQAE
jgi:hypothetical protein